MNLNLAQTRNKSLWIALFVFFIITCSELIAILILNSGHLVFTLDDPYIHLALAENILNGHYGVNRNEFSAPSSSILWPFIIAPFSPLAHSAYVLLAINLLASIGIIFLYWKVLIPTSLRCRDLKNNFEDTRTLAALLVISIPTINLIGLMYTGMEHSVQLFFSTLIIYGLVNEIENKKNSWLLIASIVIAPLIRYECLALSLPSLLFLYLRGYRTKPIIATGLLLIFIASFSFFLVNLGLNPFPTSIVAKSSVVSSGGGIMSLLGQLKKSLTSLRGFLLFVVMIFLLVISFKREKKKELRLLAIIVSISVLLHLLVGRYGWYSRYEIYIWSSSILVLLYLNKNSIYQLPNKIGFNKMVAVMLMSTVVICFPYVKVLITTPLASSNIYEQQYQMHRFAIEYYNKPIAVNDLGYVSYRNDNYVLDLWGLASIDALKLRTGNRVNWITKITQNKNVKLAMIYEDWFGKLPENWKKLGNLSLGKKQITTARPSVSFYSIGCKSFTNISYQLKKFTTTLPKGVVFEFAPNNCINLK